MLNLSDKLSKFCTTITFGTLLIHKEIHIQNFLAHFTIAYVTKFHMPSSSKSSIKSNHKLNSSLTQQSYCCLILYKSTILINAAHFSKIYISRLTFKWFFTFVQACFSVYSPETPLSWIQVTSVYKIHTMTYRTAKRNLVI
jgi:hypothetical protein